MFDAHNFLNKKASEYGLNYLDVDIKFGAKRYRTKEPIHYYATLYSKKLDLFLKVMAISEKYLNAEFLECYIDGFLLALINDLKERGLIYLGNEERIKWLI